MCHHLDQSRSQIKPVSVIPGCHQAPPQCSLPMRITFRLPLLNPIRPVNQIDLVPTLALLLGLPIPFSNLGKPIEEAFAGKKGDAWENLAAIARMTAAGIKRYQAAYWQARGIDESTLEGSPHTLWETAETARRLSRKAGYSDCHPAHLGASSSCSKKIVPHGRLFQRPARCVWTVLVATGAAFRSKSTAVDIRQFAHWFPTVA